MHGSVGVKKHTTTISKAEPNVNIDRQVTRQDNARFRVTGNAEKTMESTFGRQAGFRLSAAPTRTTATRGEMMEFIDSQVTGLK